DTRAACRSSAGGEARNCATAHHQSRFPNSRFHGSVERGERGRARGGRGPGSASAGAARASAAGRRFEEMTAPFYIALRFATHRKRALLLSLVGVVFGVGIFICTQAQTQGFAQFFVNSTIGSNGALILRSRFQPRYEGLVIPTKNVSALPARRNYFEGIHNVSEIMRVSRQFSNVVACSPVLRGNVSARSGFETTNVELFGIDPPSHLRATDLAKQIIDGKFDDFTNNTSAVILGYRLAEQLEVGCGDSIQLLSPGGEYWRFVVAAIARSGVGTIDSTRVYAQTRVAQ